MLSRIEVLAAFIGNMVNDRIATPDNQHPLSVNSASTEHQLSINKASTECQQSANDFGCCNLCNPGAVLI